MSASNCSCEGNWVFGEYHITKYEKACSITSHRRRAGVRCNCQVCILSKDAIKIAWVIFFEKEWDCSERVKLRMAADKAML